MKLYTKTGDDGTTGLFSGERIGKDSPRIEACGVVDELNSAIGLAAAGCGHDELSQILTDIQHRLFEVGADLITPVPAGGETESNNQSAAVPRIGPPQIAEVERHIDAACDTFPPLNQFVLPGGCELAARLHIARTACRRAERRVVELSRREQVNQHVVVYLNRLSDLLFAMARRANQFEGVEDVVWPGRDGF